MRISLIVDPRCGSDSSQAPVQRRLILTPNKYRKSAVRPSAMGELQGANTRSSKKKQKQQKRNSTHNTEFSFHAIFVIESGLGSVEPVSGSSPTRRQGPR